jgi:ABC-type glycerol-3-phosphate transport system substrate-binding protein
MPRKRRTKSGNFPDRKVTMTKRRTKIVGIIAVLALTACLAGCPAGDKWQQAASTSDNLIKSVDAAQDLEISFYHSQLPPISAEEHIRIQQGFKKIAQLDKALNAAIRSGNKSDSLVAYNAAFAGLDEALAEGVFNVKNPTANLALKGALDGTRFLLIDIRNIATGK